MSYKVQTAVRHSKLEAELNRLVGEGYLIESLLPYKEVPCEGGQEPAVTIVARYAAHEKPTSQKPVVMVSKRGAFPLDPPKN